MAAIGGVTRTVQSIVDETRRQLQSGSFEDRYSLTNSITDSETDIVVDDDIDGIGKGTMLENGLEQMYVRSVDTGTKTITVFRGQNGTDAAAASAGDILTVNPSWPAQDIFLAIIDEISSLQGSGLHQYEVFEFAYDGFDKLYDLDADVASRTPLFVYESFYEKSQRFNSWAPTRVQLIRGLDTNDYPSGFALKMIGKPRHHFDLYGPVTSNFMVRSTVAYSLGIPSTISGAVDEDTNGITPTIAALLATGAAWRLVLNKGIRRLNPDHSHGSRRSEEIPGDNLPFLGRALQGRREDLLRSALESQYQQYPPRTDV